LVERQEARLEREATEAETVCRSGRMPVLSGVHRHVTSAISDLQHWLAHTR